MMNIGIGINEQHDFNDYVFFRKEVAVKYWLTDKHPGSISFTPSVDRLAWKRRALLANKIWNSMYMPHVLVHVRKGKWFIGGKTSW